MNAKNDTPRPLAGLVRDRPAPQPDPATRPSALPDTELRRNAPTGIQADWQLVAPALKEALLQAFEDRAFPVYLHGDPGRGKTSAAACCCRSATWQPRWVTAAELVRAFQSARTARDGLCYSFNDYGESEDRLWQRFAAREKVWGAYHNPCLLVVDDIGIRAPSDSAFGIILELVDRRRGLPTIYTSNLSPDELANVYDGRVASRILAGQAIKITGADRRLEEKEILEVRNDREPDK